MKYDSRLKKIEQRLKPKVKHILTTFSDSVRLPDGNSMTVEELKEFQSLGEYEDIEVIQVKFIGQGSKDSQ